MHLGINFHFSTAGVYKMFYIVGFDSSDTKQVCLKFLF